MLPEGGLSQIPVQGRFIYDLGVDLTPTLDYKTGGIAFQDPTKGHDYQIWRGKLLNAGTDNSKIALDGRFNPEQVVLEYPMMFEFNFCFDFSMRPMVVFLAKEIEIIGQYEQVFDNCYLYWFDNTKGKYDLLFFGSVIKTPKLLMDDPRMVESDFYNLSDVCLFYWRSGNLFVRYLRDRFTVEHLLKRNVPYIERVGMNEHYRLQWDLLKTKQECESKTIGNQNGCSKKP